MKMFGYLLVFSFLLGQAWASEKSVYDFSWLDQDKEIYVLQNRKFRKDGRFYVGATGVKTLSGAFVDSYGFSGRAGYFFKEDWGIEFLYGQNSGSENSTAKGVKSQGTVPFYRKIDSYYGGLVTWSPFYAKVNAFNQIFYYDWTFGAGAASVKTQDNRGKFESIPSDSLTTEDNVAGIWNIGFRFYVTPAWSLRFDFTGFHYNADRSTKQGTTGPVSKSSTLNSSYDMGAGLNYSF